MNVAAAPSLTIGVEEEYLLVDSADLSLVPVVPPELMIELGDVLGEQVTPELMQCQLEVGTEVCSTMPQVRSQLAHLRSTAARIAASHGLRLCAASTHPFGRSELLQHTRKERYEALVHDLQGLARRLVISGMHVHVCIDDPDMRIDFMNQTSYVLPHLLALSTSSPFWEGHDTGLKSYRLAVWDELPRTGFPPYFESWADYRRHVSVLVDNGLIDDGTKVWWDLRPSATFPTLEMRITDTCTRLDDAVCIAALFRCWLHMLWRLRRENMRWRTYLVFLLDENRWRAQRYGFDESLLDFGRGRLVPFADLTEELLDLLLPDADELGCTDEILHARVILQRGTSAHRQLQVYADARSDGVDHDQALREVVARLVAETVEL